MVPNLQPGPASPAELTSGTYVFLTKATF